MTTPELERNIEAIARSWEIKTTLNANSKNIEIPSIIAAGIIKYQKFSSKKDSSFSSSISQTDDEQAMAVIFFHLFKIVLTSIRI
ncbi:MAG: hypothetical protein ACFFDF_08455 [Candidatus Odinarchaeota archaeon]